MSLLWRPNERILFVYCSYTVSIIDRKGWNCMQKERSEKILDIGDMLSKMSDEQVDNVHIYTTDEYKEPNHEAVALDAIIKLSRKYSKKTVDN